jgi:glutathione S-transferase
MSLTLYYHPLASYCWKALIALYESELDFQRRLIDLSDERQRAELLALYPLGKFPVLVDHARSTVVPESTIIIEYLTQQHPARTPLIAADPDLARETRTLDRFFDLYVHERMQKIVSDRLRPADQRDRYGVEQAKSDLETSYAILDRQLAGRRWALGEQFSLADCAAAPALYYANRVVPLANHDVTAAYLARLHERPSFARVFEEAQPYLPNFPVEKPD